MAKKVIRNLNLATAFGKNTSRNIDHCDASFIRCQQHKRWQLLFVTQQAQFSVKCHAASAKTKAT